LSNVDEQQPVIAEDRRAVFVGPGAVVDERLRIDAYLGSGGMCDVYSATHLVLQKQVAVKFLKRRLAGDLQHIKRFEREAVIISKLKHPNLIEVFAFGVFDGRPYIAMELLAGRSLAQLLESIPSSKLAAEQALPLFGQICDALAAAHADGVIHRDLKPSNIMLVDNDTTVKLMDFGIAKVVPESGHDLQKLTQTGDLIGSIPYMSPEQCQGQQLDARSDIYSLGCLMYETLTGKCAFTGHAPLAVLVKHVEGKIEDSPELSTPIGRVVLQAMSKNPTCRPSSAQALKHLLLNPPRSLRLFSARRIKIGAVMASVLSIAALVVLLVIPHAVEPGKQRSIKRSKETSQSTSRAVGKHAPDALAAARYFTRDPKDADAAVAQAESLEETYKQVFATAHSASPGERKLKQLIFQKTFDAERRAQNLLYEKSRESGVSPSVRMAMSTRAIHFLESAAEHAQQNGFENKYEWLKGRQAVILSETGRGSEALSIAEDILTKPEPPADDLLAREARHFAYMASCPGLESRGDDKGVYRLCLRWHDYAQRFPSSGSSLNYATNNLGDFASRLGNFKLSIKWYQELAQLADDSDNWSDLANWGMGKAYYELSKQAEGKQKSEQLKQAREHLKLVNLDGTSSACVHTKQLLHTIDGMN